jgi:hypothetical protein
MGIQFSVEFHFFTSNRFVSNQGSGCLRPFKKLAIFEAQKLSAG